MKKEIVVKAENLVKKFGDFVANDHLNFEIYKGEVFGFLGANGAGKTTTIKILCGLLRPTSGKVTVNGLDVNAQSEKIKEQIGYMSQKFSLYDDMTIRENIRFYGGIYGLSRKQIKTRTDEYINDLQLEPYLGRLVGGLPLGIKQKLAFSVAKIHDPAIVFLDEPTSGVDPVTRRRFWDMIYGEAARGKTIFITTHYMDEAEYCDRITIMADGRIEALGSPAALKKEFHSSSVSDIFLLLARGKNM